MGAALLEWVGDQVVELALPGVVLDVLVTIRADRLILRNTGQARTVLEDYVTASEQRGSPCELEQRHAVERPARLGVRSIRDSRRQVDVPGQFDYPLVARYARPAHQSGNPD